MIFSRFFRSKHLDTNPQVRIKAIDKLDKELSAEKSVLHELAFNDPDASVSLAALQKLDSFTLWYKMSAIGKDERVLKKSQQVVEKMLFDEANTALSTKDKMSFVRQCTDIKLLEKLVFLSWVQIDPQLTQSLLAKLAKPLITEKVLLETLNTELQAALLVQLNDDPNHRKLLNKLVKKGNSEQIKQQAHELLQFWDQQKLLPLRVEKDTKMLLSRLLALKEQGDLAFILEQQQLFNIQYAELSAQFSCLAESKKHEFEQKWLELNQRLQKSIDTLTPQWQEQLAQRKILDSIAVLQKESTQVFDRVNALLNESIVDLSQQEVEQHEQRLKQLYDEAKHLVTTLDASKDIERKKLQLLIERVIQSQESLANLPDFILCLDQSRELLKQFGDLKLPSDISQIEAAEQYLRESKQRWRVTTQRFNNNLPADLVKQWQKATTEWQSVIKKLNEQVNQQLSRCRNKYRAIEGLINQGRFRAAIDLYGKVLGWYEKLPEKQQASLQKLHSQVLQQIENLKDWQEYIATPRKPALLTEAELLVTSPLEIEQQAQAIKGLRQQWNSLGVIDSEADQALNQAFDETLENAFAPCRAHYEQQQAIRSQNLQEKTAILTELKGLLESSQEPVTISKKLNVLQQQWRKVGEVEFSLRNDLYEQFQCALKPLKEQVNAYYRNNAELKEHLLLKAKKCLELESIDEAINQVKALQLEWKTIAHAGRKSEAELWPAFRQVCDTVFAKRNELNEQQKALQNQQIEQVKQQLSAMQMTITKAVNRSDFEQAIALKTNILELLFALPNQERVALERQLQSIEKSIEQGIATLESTQTQRHYALIFKVLALWQKVELLPTEISELSNSWQQAFTCQTSNQTLNRQELTLMLEIVKQQDSPKSEAALRQNIQMKLMAQKLQNGALEEPEDLLRQWIGIGPVTPDEQSLFERTQRLFTE